MVVALLYNGTWLLGKKLENILCSEVEGNWISFYHILQLYEALLRNLTFEGFIWFALLSVSRF